MAPPLHAAPLQERALRNPLRFCPGREAEHMAGPWGPSPGRRGPLCPTQAHPPLSHRPWVCLVP